jgi:hypothetical protein
MIVLLPSSFLPSTFEGQTFALEGSSGSNRRTSRPTVTKKPPRVEDTQQLMLAGDELAETGYRNAKLTCRDYIA